MKKLVYIYMEYNGSLAHLYSAKTPSSPLVPVLHKGDEPVNYLTLGATEWGEIIDDLKKKDPVNGYRFDFINK